MTENGTGSGLAGLGRAPHSPYPPSPPTGPDLPVSVAPRGGPATRDPRELWPEEPPELSEPSARKGNEPMSMRAFLQDLRANGDPDHFPVLGAHMANSGVSQGRVAAALGVSEKTYRLLERGLIAWTPQRVEALARLFRLNAAERTVLYRLTLGWEPEAETGAVGLTPEMRMLIEAFPYPAYLVDPLLTLLHHNAGFAAWFPEVTVGTNIGRWVLCHPAARSRLVDWTVDWALPVIARLRSAQLRVPADYRAPLAALIDDIRLSDTVAGRLWQVSPADFEFRESGLRRIDPPGGERVTFRLWSGSPLGSPRCCLTALIRMDA